VADPLSDSAIAEALSAAGSAHHQYEQTALKGVRDELRAGFYAAFVLGWLGDFTAVTQRSVDLMEDRFVEKTEQMRIDRQLQRKRER
jgi:hypothetical protein